MKLEISQHTMERTIARIAKRHLKSFVAAVKKVADTENLSGEWTIKVVGQNGLIGYAVGGNRYWRTTLGPNFNTRPLNRVITVRA